MEKIIKRILEEQQEEQRLKEEEEQKNTDRVLEYFNSYTKESQLIKSKLSQKYLIEHGQILITSYFKKNSDNDLLIKDFIII